MLATAAIQRHQQRRNALVAMLSPQAIRAMRRARAILAPRRRMTTLQWAETFRHLDSGRLPGVFRVSNQPTQRGVLAALDDPAVDEVWGQKSSQWGWTQGIILNKYGHQVCQAPSPILFLFSKEDAARRFNREKLEPMIKATPALAKRIQLGARSSSNTWDFKSFPGGFSQLFGSNSPANLKSTDAPLLFVEEPNDTNQSVADQGGAIVIFRERKKGFYDGKMIGGGTPAVAGHCVVEDEMKKSDKRRFFITCPHCDHPQTLHWSQVKWLKDQQASPHPTFGAHRPDTARYTCEACFVHDELTEENITEAGAFTQAVLYRLITEAAAGPDYGWRATAPFTGVAGFYINDLMSFSPEARMSVLARKFLAAKQKLKTKGDDGDMRSFINNQLGETYEIRSEAPEIEVLQDRALPYGEWTCPPGGLELTFAVDVQRGGESSGEPRLELEIDAWGRGEENWLCAYIVIPGNPLDPATWAELEKYLAKPVRNLGGGLLHVSAGSIDSGDGMTADAVYGFVRPRQHLRYMATKGSSKENQEIFTPPKKSVDTNAMSKAARYGVKPYEVGTSRAKDLIYSRLQLTGHGPGRIHWGDFVGTPYYEGLTSEVRVPAPRGKRAYQVKAGVRNEPLDLKVLNFHAARRLRLHTRTEAEWKQVEANLRQRTLSLDVPAARLRATPPGAAAGDFADIARLLNGGGGGR